MSEQSSPPVESFKPIRLKYDESAVGRALFALRLVVDLQAATIYAFLRAELPPLRGTVLDVGCGESPFAHLLSPEARYVGIDIEDAATFGMASDQSILRYDGTTLPFADDSMDHILCTEVLEHVEDPQSFVAELYRVLKPGGSLIATVPFSARVHHAPHDFHRFTFWRLLSLFGAFANVAVTERGSDITSIASKIVVIAVRLAKPQLGWNLIWRLPLAIPVSALAGIAVAVAHLGLVLGIGSPADPLGYAIRAIKDDSA
jgi:SAM-dependent methyltransferase